MLLKRPCFIEGTVTKEDTETWSTQKHTSHSEKVTQRCADAYETHPRREPAGAQRWGASWWQKFQWFVLRRKKIYVVINKYSFHQSRLQLSLCFFYCSLCGIRINSACLGPLGGTSGALVCEEQRERATRQRCRRIYGWLHHASAGRGTRTVLHIL